MIAVIFLLLSIVLFFYSFTQVDLNLTLTDQSLLADIQHAFQYIGYFQRPLSTVLYIVLISSMTVFYFFVLRKIRPSLFTSTSFKLISVSFLLLLFSYPAFSYDIFNYLFDARIVTFYGENPYAHRALDFPEDPWTTFMRWTHRTYPYGPTWLAISIPLSYIGYQKFVITLYLFKALAVGSLIASARAIYVLSKKIQPNFAYYSAALILFNPLMIIETAVSGHHDSLMMACALWALYFVLQKRYILSVVLFLVSIGIKYATIFLVPAYLYVWWHNRSSKKINWYRALLLALGGMSVAVVAASMRTQFQPWYLIFVFPFIALFPRNRYSVLLLSLLSLTGLAMYVPYLYTGAWDPPIPAILRGILYIGVGVTTFGCLVVSKVGLKSHT